MATINSTKGVEVVTTVNHGKTILIRYSDYNVFKSPPEDCGRAATAAGLDEK